MQDTIVWQARPNTTGLRLRKVYGFAFEWSCGHIVLLLLIHSAFEQSSYQIPYTIARLSRSSSNINPWSSLVVCSLYAPFIRRNG